MKQTIEKESELIPIAKITRTQGRRGEFRVRIDLEDFRLFEAGRHVFVSLEGRTTRTELESLKLQHGRWVAKLRGIDSIADAESWVGARIAIPSTNLLPPPEGTYFSFDLEGCEVRTAGETIGTVSEVLDQPGTTLLSVDRRGQEVLIPFVQAYLREIDTEGKRIEVDLPDGLLELNE